MQQIGVGYCNHMDPSIPHPITGDVFIAFNDTVVGSDRKNRYNLKVMRYRLDGSTQLVKEYVQGSSELPGPAGYSGCQLLPDGSLLVTIARGDGTNVRAHVDRIPGVAPAWSLGDAPPTGQPTPVPATPPPSNVDAARVAALEQQVKSLQNTLAQVTKDVAATKTDAAQTKTRLAALATTVAGLPTLDVVWQKTLDAIYFAAHQQDGWLPSWVWQKALDASYSFAKQRGLLPEDADGTQEEPTVG